jgi:hypothetical protein
MRQRWVDGENQRLRFTGRQAELEGHEDRRDRRTPLAQNTWERSWSITKSAISGAVYDEDEGEAMTAKEALHNLVEELPDEQADLACSLLEDLHNAADVDGPPLAAETLASLDRGLADIAAGRCL